MVRGLMIFKDKRCFFSLDNFELVIEEIDDRDKVTQEDYESLFKRRNDFPENLVGKDFDDHTVVFKVIHGSKVGKKTYSAKVQSYIIYKNDESLFDEIQFISEELNWFYDTRYAYELYEIPENGQTQIQTYEYTKTDRQFSFKFDDELINGRLNISRHWVNTTSPLKLFTELSLYFNQQPDYKKLLELTYGFINVLSFLCYRRNISMTKADLKKLDEKTGLYEKVGTLFVSRFSENVEKDYKSAKKRIIDISLIDESLGSLFEKIFNKQIYLRHIPESLRDQKITTLPRFIMAMAGFEWQYLLSNKDKVEDIEFKFKKQKKEILDFLNQKIEATTGKEKGYYKGIRKLVDKDKPLSDRIEVTLIKYNDILSNFIKQLYSHAGQDEKTPKLDEIARRVATYRNKVAHGDLEESDYEFLIFDLRVMEWLYYSMVLDEVGVSGENIKRALNKLFNLNYPI
ncbi:HEPN domain-containing protein [Bacillus halotolerans]|uniref:HEPN domain-containing protein n=1 Tax=Bacillus halotolerans TaxID=260554 RepID=UPI003F6A7831